MAIENIDEIKAYLAENKDSEDVKTFMAELTPKVTTELVSAFLETEEGLRILKTHPETDRRVSSGVETAIKKEREKMDGEIKRAVAAEMLKRNPAETEQEKQIRELRESFESEKAARARETLQRQLIEEGSKKKVDAIALIEAGWMPSSLEEGLVALDKVAKRDADLEARIRNELVASGSYKPGSGRGEQGKLDIKTLTKEQMIELELKGELDKYLTA
jgi:hypothetical protein